MHARSLIVDDDAVVGSVGWTPQSVFNTEELSVHIHSARLTAAMAAQFIAWSESLGASARSGGADASRMALLERTGAMSRKAAGRDVVRSASTVLESHVPARGKSQEVG